MKLALNVEITPDEIPIFGEVLVLLHKLSADITVSDTPEKFTVALLGLAKEDNFDASLEDIRRIMLHSTNHKKTSQEFVQAFKRTALSVDLMTSPESLRPYFHVLGLLPGLFKQPVKDALIQEIMEFLYINRSETTDYESFGLTYPEAFAFLFSLKMISTVSAVKIITDFLSKVATRCAGFYMLCKCIEIAFDLFAEVPREELEKLRSTVFAVSDTDFWMDSINYAKDQFGWTNEVVIRPLEPRDTATTTTPIDTTANAIQVDNGSQISSKHLNGHANNVPNGLVNASQPTQPHAVQVAQPAPQPPKPQQVVQPISQPAPQFTPHPSLLLAHQSTPQFTSQPAPQTNVAPVQQVQSAPSSIPNGGGATTNNVMPEGKHMRLIKKIPGHSTVASVSAYDEQSALLVTADATGKVLTWVDGELSHVPPAQTTAVPPLSMDASQKWGKLYVVHRDSPSFGKYNWSSSGWKHESALSKPQLKRMSCVRLVPQTSKVIVGEENNKAASFSVRLYDANNTMLSGATAVHSFDQEEFVTTLEVTDSSRFIAGCKDGAIFAYDGRTAHDPVGRFVSGESKGKLTAHNGIVFVLRSLDANQFISGSWSGDISLWDYRNYSSRISTLTGFDKPRSITSIKRPTGHLAVVASENKLTLVDLNSSTVMDQVVDVGDYHRVAADPQRGRLYAIGRSGTLDHWNLSL